MRWKLILLTSLITSLSSVSLIYGISRFFFGSILKMPEKFIVIFAFGLLTLLIASVIFVYRHTARRRKTQGFLTAAISLLLISITLTLLLFRF
jgi:Na+/melibiose symporter-like transporter